MSAILPLLQKPPHREALRIGDQAISYAELASEAGSAAQALAGMRRVAIVAFPTIETVAGIAGAMAAGVAVIPISPSAAPGEIEHIVSDSAPDAVLAPTGDLPAALRGLPIVSSGGQGHFPYREVAADDPERTVFILYSSGTTGPPKGAQIPRRAVISNLDALTCAWDWSAEDRLVHALPLFHVHGLVLGTLGPLRLGGHVEHLGRFSPESVARAISAGASMVFGVPTMYHRLADACESSPELASSIASARLLVSGSAALPAYEHQRIEDLSGQLIVERYGMTETLINTSVRAGGERRPGYVGLPVDGVQVCLLDDNGKRLDVPDDETIGEIAVRGPNLFTGYLNREDATAEAMRDGWFITGDMATRSADGYLRIVGRRSTDIIKSGGFKIGAGEIEGALLEHPAVAEVAVKGEPDLDLGDRVVAWVVVRPGASVSVDELVAHASTLLSKHKLPREIHFVDSLPRNAMGKVVKNQLAGASPGSGGQLHLPPGGCFPSLGV